MTSYNNDVFGILNSDLYFDMFEKRGVKFLRIRKTKDFSNLSNIDIEISTEYVWSQGDNLHKLSNRFYNDSSFWWCIGIVNGKPTDGHYKIGDIIYIPLNPTFVVEALD